MLRTLLACTLVIASAGDAFGTFGNKPFWKLTGGKIPGPPTWEQIIDESNGEHRFFGAQNTYPFPGVSATQAVFVIDTATNHGAGIGAVESSPVKSAGFDTEWYLSIRLKIVEASALGGQALRISTGLPWSEEEEMSRYIGLQFGLSDDGDPIVGLEGSEHVFEIDGAAGQYISVFFKHKNVGLRRHSLLAVDGQLLFKGDFFGVGGPMTEGGEARMLWGDLDPSADVNGRAFWADIRVRGTPEPSGFVLLMMGLASVGSVRMRRAPVTMR